MMGDNYFYVVDGTEPLGDKVQYLCRKPSGDFKHYWGCNREDALRFRNTNSIPNASVDLSDALWLDSEGNELGYLFD